MLTHLTRATEQVKSGIRRGAAGAARILRLVAIHTYIPLWIALTILHFGQTIIFSGGERIPGNEGDARLTNLLIEHMHRFLTGKGEFLDHLQFYPFTRTLAYGDGHVGTAPIYSIFRIFGGTIEHSFQGWHLANATLNALAMLYLLRSLRVNRWLAGPFIFVAVSHSMMTGKMGHPQLLPVFPFLFCIGAIIRFLREPRSIHLCVAVLAYAHMHLCYLYYGFLGSVVIGLVIICGVAVNARHLRQVVRRPSIAGLLACISVTIGAVAALAWLYQPYAEFAKARGRTNTMELLRALAPDVGAWISAQQTSLLYSHMFSATGPYDYEKRLFMGALLMLAPALAVIAAMAYRRIFEARMVLTMCIASLVCAIIVTSAGTDSLFLRVAEQLEPIRAFRAFGRIAYLLLPLLAASVAATGAILLRENGGKPARILLGWITVVILVESFSMNQAAFSYEIAPIERRVTELACTLALGDGSGPFGVIMAAPSQGPHEALHLDAWQAGMRVGRRCVNGYAGNTPDVLTMFEGFPSMATLDAALLGAGVRERSVEVIQYEGAPPMPQLVARRLPSHEPGKYEWGDTILFSGKGAADQYIRSGFAPIGGDLRWTLGKQASMSLKVTPPRGPQRLRFSAIGFLYGRKLPRQRVEIFINSSKLATVDVNLPYLGEYTVPLPKEMTKGIGRMLDITLKLPDAAAPASLKVNDDTRVLAVALSTLNIEPVPAIKMPELYKWGRELDFGTGTASNIYIKNGFDLQPGGWRWTTAKEAALRFPVSATSQERCLVMEAVPLVSPRLPAQTVSIALNGKPAGELVMRSPNPTVYRQCFDPALISGDSLLITFRMPRAASPASMGMSSDNRLLSFAVKKLRLE